MFDMGFTEMMLIGIVALIVIGPERLPAVARTVGKYFGRLKRFMTTVKADVEQELRADELREILAQQQQQLNSIKDTINDAGREIEKEASALDQAGNSIAGDLSSSIEQADEPAPGAQPAHAQPSVPPPTEAEPVPGAQPADSRASVPPAAEAEPAETDKTKP